MKKPVTIKLLATLKNMLGMYEYGHMEVLVLEAVANGIDAGADTSSISFERNSGKCYVTFHNNGAVMDGTDFKNYHTVSASTKRKGEGIGFAGVGAKIFMAAWPDAEIVTITGEGSSVLVSRMWRETQEDDEDEVVWDSTVDGASVEDVVNHIISDHERGTTYRVRVPEDGYVQLRKDLRTILRFWFNAALVSKQLSLIIEGVPVLPWRPDGKHFQKTSKYKDYRMPCHIWVASNEISDDLRDITYYVHGKRIKNELVDWSAQLKSQYEKRVFCMADVTVIAEHLTTNKENFERNFHTNKIIKKIKHDFYEVLKNNGYLRDTSDNVDDSGAVVNELTERLNKVLRTPELKQFNPFAKLVSHDLPNASNDGSINVSEMAGSQTSMSTGNSTNNKSEDAPGGNLDGTSHYEDAMSGEPGELRRRRSRGISIIPIDAPQNQHEGWLDPSTGAVVYNVGHEFYKRTVNNPWLRDYNLARVVIASLIRAKNGEIEMDADTTFKHFENILHKVWI